jgi:hypothetical protein
MDAPATASRLIGLINHNKNGLKVPSIVEIFLTGNMQLAEFGFSSGEIVRLRQSRVV